MPSSIGWRRNVRDEPYSVRYYAMNGRPMTQAEWSHALSRYKHVGWTELRVRGLRLEVSTVWLGLDHNWSRHGPPLIFETMVFVSPRRIPFEDLMCRYSTLAQAQAGHVMMVRTVKRIVREIPRPKQLIHNGRKPMADGRPTAGRK